MRRLIMRKKSVFGMLVIMLVIMFVFTACAPDGTTSETTNGNDPETTDEGNATDTTNETEEAMPIVLMLRNYASPPTGWEAAADELSKIALEQGNFDLEIVCEASSTMTET